MLLPRNVLRMADVVDHRVLRLEGALIRSRSRIRETEQAIQGICHQRDTMMQLIRTSAISGIVARSEIAEYRRRQAGLRRRLAAVTLSLKTQEEALATAKTQEAQLVTERHQFLRKREKLQFCLKRLRMQQNQQEERAAENEMEDLVWLKK